MFGYVNVTTQDVKIESFWLMPATPKYCEDGIPYITSKNIKDGEIDFSDVKYIKEEDYITISKNREIRENDLLITMIGTIGECAFVKKYTKFYGQNIYALRLDDSIVNRRYYYYYLSSEKIKNALVSKKNASSQGYIKAGSIDNLIIPLPPIETQNYIVKVLDKFEIMCNNLSQGLPAEIEARKKQYEYYRDKLLAFEMKK